MEALIVIVIVVYVVYMIKEEQKREQKKAAMAKSEYPEPEVAQLKNSSQQSISKTAKKVQAMQQRSSNSINRSREDSESKVVAELRAKREAQANKPRINHAPNDPNHQHVHLNNVNPVQEKLAAGSTSDILVRANRNTEAYAEDTLHEQDCDLHAESEGTLGKVEDLMVCGFSGNLNFEHDILGEATSMLLRMEKLP